MGAAVWVFAVYGLVSAVFSVVGMFRLKTLRRKYAQEEEDQRRKMAAFEKRHSRIRKLMARKLQLLNAHILDGQEVETIDIELLTLLDEVLADEEPDEFYQGWRNELIQRVTEKPGGGN